jgi:hypothetical protein
MIIMFFTAYVDEETLELVEEKEVRHIIKYSL